MRRVFEQTVRNALTKHIIARQTLVYDETEDYFARPAFTLELIRQERQLVASHITSSTEALDED